MRFFPLLVLFALVPAAISCSDELTLPDRATIANMTPEYGATVGFFPVDAETLSYMRLTGRDESMIALVEAYTKTQGLFRTENTPDPVFSVERRPSVLWVQWKPDVQCWKSRQPFFQRSPARYSGRFRR